MTRAFQPGQHRYRITSLRASSAKYGDCEVCRKNVSEVHVQVEERRFEIPASDRYAGTKGWTQHQCNSLFGHEQCLVSRRRGAFATSMQDPVDRRTYAVHDPVSLPVIEEAAA